MANRPYLPLELIDEFYRLLFPPSFFDHGEIVAKPAWKDLEGSSLASKGTRNIVLRLWFHVLRISDLEDWNAILWNWTRLYQWTRAIHYTSTVYKTPRCLIEPFTRLNSLRIDLPTTHETDQGDFDFASPELAQIIRESIPANAVQHLEIRGITWLDPFVMRHIADGVPNLRTLRLMQPFVWCGLCNTIGAPSFETIPARMIYADGAGLPDGYTRSLAPLKYLHTVTLTVACGEGSTVYDSLFSHAMPRLETVDPSPSHTLHPASPASITPASEQHTSRPMNSGTRRSFGWSGECDSCMLQLLDDETFREAWRARRWQALTSDPPPRRPPSLRRVEWNLLNFSNQNWPDLLPMYTGSMYFL